eukprot:TRINITY_DN1404_c0_g1_i1.p1 TRINITY_DN1404_c0_g1~~TRINITY_DN1404_c0_g1_i1.p1  ORF type:complete len:1840 (+),score=629.05 TRINITY_DN1404_c0_g1_i1:76-5595(+)
MSLKESREETSPRSAPATPTLSPRGHRKSHSVSGMPGEEKKERKALPFDLKAATHERSNSMSSSNSLSSQYNSIGGSGISPSSSGSLPLPIPPLEVIDFESAYKESQTDPLAKELILFPSDDITFTTKPKDKRIATVTVPHEGTLEPHIRDCLEFYNSDWKIVKRKQDEPASTPAAREDLPPLSRSNSMANGFLPPSPALPRIPKFEGEIDIDTGEVHDKSNEEQPDDISPELLADYNGKQTDDVNKQHRQKERIELFKCVPSAIPEPTFKLPAVAPFSEQKGIQILVDVKSLTFALGEVEPVFGILAIYDLGKKKKVSENFYFECNSNEMTKLLEEHQKVKDPITMAKKALFTVTNPSVDLYFVLRVEKVLQGDNETVSEPYIKHSSIRDREKERLVAQTQQFCSRLGQFKQPFCWSMVPIFGDDGKLAIGNETDFKPMYRQKATDISDAHFLEMINEYSKNGGSTKRNKTIPGTCTADVSEAPPNLAGKFNASLVAIPPLTTQTAQTIIREIQELPSSSNPTSPHLDFVNNLYVYPEMLNFNNRGGSVGARNITVKVQLLDNDENFEGLKVVYGRASSEAMSTYALTSATYHNKAPQFYDEIKIRLPAQLTDKHHLLFTFYHITCQLPKVVLGAKTGPSEVQTVVGYAVLPVYQKNRVTTKSQMLPVAMELTPKYLTPDVEAALKYVDGKKPLFKVDTELVSTIYSTDKHVNAFFQHYHVHNDPKLQKIVQDLLKVKAPIVIQFLPVLFNQLFRVMCHQPEAISYTAFTVLTNLLQNIYSATADAAAILNNYVDFVFENPSRMKTAVYEQLTQHWYTLLKKNVETDNSIKYSWFLFNVIFKSMVHKSQIDNSLSQDSRTGRFSTGFITKLKDLIEMLTYDLQQRTKSGLNLAKELNKSLAIFLRNMLSVMDRGTAFQIIERFAREITSSNTDSLIEFKVEFLRSICDYEYYVQLNLPVEHKDIESVTSLVSDFQKKHFLSGLLLNEVSTYANHKDKNVRSKVMQTLRNLLAKHDLDPRYQDKAVKERIATMYFPFVVQVLDNFDTFKEAEFDEKRTIFVCFLFIIKNIPRNFLSLWWKKETQTRVVLFFEALLQCSEVFEFVGEEKWFEKMGDGKSWKSIETKTALENYYNESGRVQQPLGSKYRSLREKRAEARKSLENKRKMSDAGQDKKYNINKILSPATSKDVFAYDENVERHLGAEASFILLDTIDLFIQDFENELRESQLSNPLMDHVFGLLLNLLKGRQSRTFLSSLYASLRAFVSKFPKHFFVLNTNYVAELCLQVVTHCNFDTTTRLEATAMLYSLMKKNYEEAKNNFTRVKVQTTIAISKLVGKGIRSARNLRRSLATISKYALLEYPPKKGKAAEEEFGNQVQELSDRLYTILRDSIKINQYSNDPEMMADLYHRIAKGYTNAPDLRVAWLESLSEVHVTQKNWAEAAQCLVHIAALVAEYLNLFEPMQGLPQGSGAFQQVSRNAIEEASMGDLSPDEEGICETHTFTETGLLKVMDGATQYLKQAELYETANEMYKLILPIHEKNRSYEKLAKSHGDLKDIFNKIISANQTQTRLLGSYYRIGFYGTNFEELDGKEYIYKEPKITRLGEIQERLKAVFAQKFKAELKIITDSNIVDRSKLDPAVNYIQITSVTAYFEPWEMKDRVTYYDRNYNLNRFIFATPFTLTGKAHAENLKDQHKRKTILTVENQFPYVKKRLLVVNKQEINLTPIENSIETIESRTDMLLSELRQVPPNGKTLQNVLQGSVLLQVHVGPKKICEDFLGNPKDYPPEQIETLKVHMKDFVKVCEDAVALNRTLIGTDLLQFHMELEQGLKELKGFTSKYLA